jgi:acyl carrier protein
MSTTIAVIKDVLASVKGLDAPAASIADDADIVADIGLDSIQMLQFMLELEARLGIRIDFDRLDFDHLRAIDVLAGVLDTMPAADEGPPP